MAEIPRIVVVARWGNAAELEQLLREGGDPNSHDGFDGVTCLMASAIFAQPECTRLLISYGADVTYAFTGANASVLYMMAHCFRLGLPGVAEDFFGEGDYILAADLLIHAGAPINTRNWESGTTALDELQQMQVIPGTKKSRERDGLISLLTHGYWGQEYGQRNPFLHATSANEVMWLLMKGAANGGDNESMDHTRVRSIRPNLRLPVLLALLKHQASCAAFMHIMSVVQDRNSTAPICVFHGMQRTVLATVADFAGMSGSAFGNAQEAAAILEDLIQEEEVTDDSDNEEIDMEETDESDFEDEDDET